MVNRALSLTRRVESAHPSAQYGSLTMTCAHEIVHCLNEYELIRKYRCEACSQVMMCACDQEIGERFLAHQLRKGCVLDTQERVPVTLGFVEGVCRECRGLPPEARPVATLCVEAQERRELAERQFRDREDYYR